MLNTLLPRLTAFEVLDSGTGPGGVAFLRVAKADLPTLLRVLDQEHGFVTLATIACTDWLEDGCFQLSWMLETGARDRCLGVQARIGRDGEAIDSVHRHWPQAEVFERELHEMFGIPVHDHPGLGDFLLEGWTHTPPMRREFDTLKFCEETFEMRAGRDDNLDVRTEIRRRKEAKKADGAPPRPKRAGPAPEAPTPTDGEAAP